MRFYFEISSSLTGQDCSVIMRRSFKIGFILTGPTCSCEDHSSKITVIYGLASPTSTLIALQAVMSYDEAPLKLLASLSCSVAFSTQKHEGRIPSKNEQYQFPRNTFLQVILSCVKQTKNNQTSIPELRKQLL